MIGKTVKLNNGLTIPKIGLGTWHFPKDLVTDAVYFAITEAGYKHIDCASIYHNEPEIGQAFEKTFKNISRNQIFITSKLWNTSHNPKNVQKECEQTLKDLKLDYLDLYLMHWGIAFKPNRDFEPIDKNGYPILEDISIQQTWEAMEDLVKKGLVKSIGVANFTATQIIDLLTYAEIKPVMNQIELHPYLSQQSLVDLCHYKEIAVTAYSPLGTPANRAINDPVLMDDPIIRKIAKSHKKSPAQILLNWGIKRGTIVIPKSVNKNRIKENIDVFNLELSDKEMDKLNNLNRNQRFVDSEKWWNIPYFG